MVAEGREEGQEGVLWHCQWLQDVVQMRYHLLSVCLESAQECPSSNQGTGSTKVPRPCLVHVLRATRAHAATRRICLALGFPQE